MENKLYVGNLSYRISEGSLKELFSGYGTVKSIKIITDYETGRSKGFGFIEMETAEEAQACIDALNGSDVEGRAININIAKEKPAGNNRRDRY